MNKKITKEAGKNNAYLPDMTTINALISQSVRAMLKGGKKPEEVLKYTFRDFFRKIDEQDAVNRFTWYNLPNDITGQEVERMLYYRGQLCFFYLESMKKFFFMPYALDGGLDFYGRYKRVHPVPYSSSGDKAEAEAQKDYLSTIKLDVKYGIKLDDPNKDDLTKSAVLLWDYSKGLGENIIPRAQVNEPMIGVMSEIIPLMRTSMFGGSGVKGLRVQDADSADEASKASEIVKSSALEGDLYVPIVGGASSVDFQELDLAPTNKPADYLMTLESLDNLRLSSYGLDNGGLYQKKAHLLESEAEMNNVNVGLVQQDGLSLRQNFCDIVNSIWNLGIWVEPSESSTGVDSTGDGQAYTDDPSGMTNAGKEGGQEDDSNQQG